MAVWKDIEFLDRLIVAAGGDERGLVEITKNLPLDELTSVLVDEIVFRANTNAAGSAFRREEAQVPEIGTVLLGVHHDGLTQERALGVRADGTVEQTTGTRGDIALRLDYDLHDLIRVLFGPTRLRPAGTYSSAFLPATAGHQRMPPLETVYQGMEVAGTVLSGLSQHHPDLSELARRYRTDKWGGLHWFTGLYERHLREFRELPVRILEIGIGGYGNATLGGESLRMWKRYFPRGLVFGVDIFDKSAVDEQRITTLRADQNDPQALIEVEEKYGPFDLVIDDGSHVNGHVRTSLETLFPRLRAGGLYVIEDLWTSYCPGYGGQDRVPVDRTTSVGMLKDIVEGIQYEEQPRPPGRPPAHLERNVVGAHVYHNLAFLEKGVNAEGGVPSWVPRHPRY
ncbi:class I SAM-dependent methyltransferase [Streptomyces sp. SID7499]|uniref:Class I SAM-dependent methyltransferase n=2 Tax=unclassified Streptomyces TaxID=2593676 RepID=A0A6G3X920_9ACTN|nr:sugar O-methyltransferase [Streptomyces sp. MK730-62F2]NEE14157.1 class I SAM-dependent methyltransferase [Streptomyces sp. SID7499]